MIDYQPEEEEDSEHGESPGKGQGIELDETSQETILLDLAMDFRSVAASY